MDPMTGIAEEIAATMRVAVRHGLVDPMGFIAARSTRDESILITPGPVLAGKLRRLSASDVARIGPDGEPLQGNVPPEAVLAAEVLRLHPETAAVAYGSPPSMMRLGAVGLDPEPLAHTNAELVYDGICRVYPTSGLALDPQTANMLLSETNGAPTVHVVGCGVLTVGRTPWEALRRIDSLELLSRLTVERVRSGLMAPVLSDEDARSIIAQRPQEKRPSRDPERYYRSRDQGTSGSSLADQWPGNSIPRSIEHARVALAVSSRLLAAEGLVTFFEHISHRAPGLPDRFLMTNATDFTAMVPDDVGVLAMKGSCEPFESRYPPAPFRWLHRDMLAARPDVSAIVHTHPIHGRVSALNGQRPSLWHRAGVGSPDEIPTFQTPSLLFDEAHRRELVGMLANTDTVHALHHGSDFLASDLASATIRAIHHERRCREDAYIRELGSPVELSDAARSDVELVGPRPSEWWDFYASGHEPIGDVGTQPEQIA